MDTQSNIIKKNTEKFYQYYNSDNNLNSKQVNNNKKGWKRCIFVITENNLIKESRVAIAKPCKLDEEIYEGIWDIYLSDGRVYKEIVENENSKNYILGFHNIEF